MRTPHAKTGARVSPMVKHMFVVVNLDTKVPPASKKVRMSSHLPENHEIKCIERIYCMSTPWPENTACEKLRFTTISYKIHLFFLVHACDSDPCKNGAICNKQGDGFTCICTDEYKGETCEEEGEFSTGVN